MTERSHVEEHRCDGTGGCGGRGHDAGHGHEGDHADEVGHGGEHSQPHGADSAGMPWAHRALPSSGFEDDTGSGDLALREAAAAVAAYPSSAGERDLLAKVAAARWLVPIVAMARDTTIEQGMRVDGHAEMAFASLTAPDGQQAVPIFSGVDTLAGWDPAARPVPVTAAQAAQSAVGEGCDTLLLDLGSAHALALRPSMVWALAMGHEWLPAHEDPVVLAGVTRAAADEPEVMALDISDGTPEASGVLRVALAVRPGLDGDAVAALATRIGEALACDGELRARIDGVSFAVRAG
ncbi:MAG: SseB family protein [Candidatus Phosphoribacter sp.]|nr:SseB family protein [Actinomycetales bacterium]